MSEHDELSPELRRLLKRASAHSAMPADAPERLFAKVSASVAIAGGVGVAGAAAQASSAKAAVGATGKLAALAKWSTLAIFASGAVVGAVAHSGYARLTAAPPNAVSAPVVAPPPPSSSAPVESPSAPASSPSAPPTATTAQPERPAPTASAVAPPTARIDETSDPDRSPAAERAALEIARTAIGRGQAAAALAELDRHAQRFPRSRFSEERDSLRIQALIIAGRTPEAKQRLEEFRKRRPKSLFLPALEAALGE